MLDLNTIMKRVREERSQQDTAKTETSRKADLISVARRAAQQAAEESSKLEAQQESDTDKRRDRSAVSLTVSASRYCWQSVRSCLPLLACRLARSSSKKASRQN
ncbi:hypothetical protein HGG75_15415 [Ochrobactrum pseudogrignonense]|nr:hypothetical protein [Brucella pseudogrignonensis]